jgi:hypothetical protein
VLLPGAIALEERPEANQELFLVRLLAFVMAGAAFVAALEITLSFTARAFLTWHD